MSPGTGIIGRTETPVAGDPPLSSAPAASGHPVLALGFGTTVVMWVIGYTCRIPPVWVPGPLLVFLLLVCLLAGGVLAGRWVPRNATLGARVGLLASVLNLLVLGSLLTGEPGESVRPSVFWWLPGSLLAGAALGGCGGWLGRRFRRDESGAPIDWTGAFAAVAAFATLSLLAVGGLVTSRKAGLDVPDWPSSFGYSMFLYPLSRMSGGIYYEHAHRLFGSLVGLTTLVLAIELVRGDRRVWVRWLVLGALALVILQGVLGGLRVTTAEIQATAQVVTATAETGRSLALRVVHGVTAQLVFGLLVLLAAVTSALWKSDHRPPITPSASTDRALSGLLVGSLLVQLVLGAIQRHLARGLLLHITMATVVLVVAVAAGARAAGLPHGQPVIRRLGRGVLWLVCGQVVLGIAALAVRGFARGQVPPPAYEMIVRTAHQVTGGVLLGLAVLLKAWSHRLLRASP